MDLTNKDVLRAITEIFLDTLDVDGFEIPEISYNRILVEVDHLNLHFEVDSEYNGSEDKLDIEIEETKHQVSRSYSISCGCATYTDLERGITAMLLSIAIQIAGGE